MAQENLRWVKKTRLVFVHRSMMTMLKDILYCMLKEKKKSVEEMKNNKNQKQQNKQQHQQRIQQQKSYTLK